MSQNKAFESPYPGAKSAWFMVALLTIAYVFSYIDRYILSLLIEPIKADMDLSDEQIGLILGPAFGFLYVFAALPIGWMVDRSRRTWIVGVGVTIWSFATAVSGMVSNFWHLFCARMMVGLGEATLSPSAMSMIGDSFPPEKRGKPISVYVAALSIGGSLASLIGAGVLVWAKTADKISLPFFGELAAWQLTFLAVGLPGLVLGLIFFFLKEPPRRPQVVEDIDVKGNGVGDALRYVANNWAVYLGFISLACVMVVIAYSHFFLPSTFERTWGWAAEKYAFVNGSILLVVGPITVVTTGYLSDKWMQAGVEDAALRLLIIGFLIMLPAGSLTMFMPTPELAYAVLTISNIGIAIVSTTAITALLVITPSQIRGQITALYYMVLGLTGSFLGSTSVGTLSTRIFGEENIRHAMAAVPVLYGVIPLLLIPITMKLYRAQLARISAAAE